MDDLWSLVAADRVRIAKARLVALLDAEQPASVRIALSDVDPDVMAIALARSLVAEVQGLVVRHGGDVAATRAELVGRLDRAIRTAGDLDATAPDYVPSEWTVEGDR